MSEYAVVDPATGETVASYPTATDEQVEQAITAATTSAADLLGRDDIGTLAVGKTADIIAVRGSPLDDVTRLEHVDFVMHRGKIAKGPQPGI